MERGLTITALAIPTRITSESKLPRPTNALRDRLGFTLASKNSQNLRPKWTAFRVPMRTVERTSLGTEIPASRGGFFSITLRCLDRAGHLAVDVVLEDDAGRYARAHAAFWFQTEPAAIDHFIESLRRIERDRFGSAFLTTT